MQQFLPLPHHPHIFVVEDENLDRAAELHGGRKLLNIHQDRGFAGNVDDQCVRMGQLRPDGGGQAIAHCAEAAGGHPTVRLLEMIMLRRPHLMLADFRGDVSLAVLGQFVKTLDRILRLDGLFRLFIAKTFPRAPFVYLRPPGVMRLLVDRMRLGAPQTHQIFQYMGAIADDRQIDLDVLVDRGRVDVDVDLFRMRRESVEPAGDAVVETRADGDHQVAIVHGVIGLIGAVHAQHAQPVLSRSRIGAEAHQSGRDREARLGDQFAQQSRGDRPGVDDAAAGVENRLFRLRHHRHGLFDLADFRLQLRLIGLVLDVFRRRIGARRELHVLRNIDHDRTGTSRTGDVKGLVQNARQVRDVAHEIIMLGAMAGDANRVGFLKGVRADQMGRNLPGDADEGNGIHQGVGEAGDGVGGAGAGGDEQAADLARRARIAFRRMGRALFMAHQHVLDLRLMEKRVIDRQDRAAGIAEQGRNTLILQGLHHHFGAGHHLRHCWAPRLFAL